MYDQEKALIVLVESHEVRQVFPAWPLEMQVAVCLQVDGTCNLAVFRREEQSHVTTRLTRQMGLTPEHVGVFPKVEGFTPHRLRFADQRRLLKLIGETRELVDEAEDYSANYAFAVEEGIDPDRLMGFDLVQDNGPDPCEPPEEVQPAPLAPSPVVEQAAPVALPRFLRPALPDGPGPGFRSARQMVREEASGTVYRVRPERDGWTVLSAPGKGSRGETLVVAAPDGLHLRQEDGVVAIELAGQTSRIRGVPPRMRIRTAELPGPMRAALCAGPSQMRVTHEDGFIFLYPVSEIPDDQPVTQIDEIARDHAKPLWRRSTFGIRGVLVLAGVSALLGWFGVESTVAQDRDSTQSAQTQGVNWQDYRVVPWGDRAG